MLLRPLASFVLQAAADRCRNCAYPALSVVTVHEGSASKEPTVKKRVDLRAFLCDGMSLKGSEGYLSSKSP